MINFIFYTKYIYYNNKISNYIIKICSLPFKNKYLIKY
jgi:hypothetical protein